MKEKKTATTRTNAAVKNIKTAFAGIFVNLFLSFYSRNVFVKILGSEYVGLSSLFGNILVMLSFLEFGVGGAGIYLLYKPIAKHDNEKISDILAFCRKSNYISGCLVTAVGISLLPVLEKITGGLPDIPHIRTIYVLYIMSSGASYLFSYRKLLLFSDQKNYINENFAYVAGIISVIFETAALYITKNYILYLAICVFSQVTEDAILHVSVKKMYPEIDFSIRRKVPEKTKREVQKQARMLVVQKIGTAALSSVDNFIVVYYFGLSGNGIYSNYGMLLGTASMLSIRIIGAVSGSVGNLGASEDEKKARKVFRAVELACFFLTSVCTVMIAVLSQDFMKLWIGEENTLPKSASFVVALLFYVMGMRESVLIFRDAYGLYYKEKIKPILEVVVTAAAAYVFAKKMGIAGIFFGRFVSCAAVCMWYEPYVLYKYGFHSKTSEYYKRAAMYFFLTASSCIVALFLCGFVRMYILKIIICLCIPSVIFVLFFGYTPEVKYIRLAIRGMRKKGN